MIQTILIVLVAVVVLIVIIAVLALRYLRADDSDTFDDIPDEPRRTRQPSNLDRERRSPAPGRRPRPPATGREGWAPGRPARAPDARGSAGYRDRETGPRPAVADRSGGPRRDPAGVRPGRPARQDIPDAATSSWDSLSDVDYWTELAADKPRVGPAPSPAPAARRVSEPAPDSRQLPAVRTSSRSAPPPAARPRRRPAAPVSSPSPSAADLSQTEQIDVRAGRHSGDIAAPGPDLPTRRGSLTSPPLQRPDPLAAGPRMSGPQRTSGPQRNSGPQQGTGPQQATGPQRAAGRQRAAGPQRAASPRSVPSAPAPRPQPASPAANSNGRGSRHTDDDPLTSPSFPAVNSSDSRSYRARRAADSQPGTSGQHVQPAAGTGVTSHQLIEYSSAPSRTTSTRGYPARPAITPPDVQQPAVPAAAANPYGSYVSQPQPASAEPAFQPAGYPDSAQNLAAAGYNGYSSGAHAGQPDGFLPSDGLNGNGNGNGNGGGRRGRRGRHGAPTNGYASIDYSGDGYQDAGYPDDRGALAGYRPAGDHAAQPDQRGYGGSDRGYGPDGYPGYSGYGASGF